jgi:hypothetical protein
MTTFEVLLYDSFYDSHEGATVDADDLESAVAVALDLAEALDLQVKEVAGDDGEVACLSASAYEVEEVNVVHTAAGMPSTDTIHALTYGMAIDLAALMFGHDSIVSIEARGVCRTLRQHPGRGSRGGGSTT